MKLLLKEYLIMEFLRYYCLAAAFCLMGFSLSIAFEYANYTYTAGVISFVLGAGNWLIYLFLKKSDDVQKSVGDWMEGKVDDYKRIKEQEQLRKDMGIDD